MFILLSALLPLLLALNCSDSYSFQGSSCVFNSHIGPSCNQFSFLNCSWQHCEQYLPSGKALLCTRYTTKYDSNWNNCIQSCCPTDLLQPPSWHALTNCQHRITQTNDAQNNTLTILLIVLAAATALLAAICCFLRHASRTQAKPAQHNHQNPNYAALPRPTMTHISDPDNDTKQDPIVYEWIHSPEQDEKFAEPCSVCLQPKVSLELQCGHAFHRKCFIECVNFKKQCVLCRSSEINKLKVYCQNCFRCCSKATLTGHLKELSTDSLFCVRCKEEKSQPYK